MNKDANLWHEKLKSRRIEYGVSQAKLASVSSISRGHLNSIENGRKKPSSKLREKLNFELDRFNPENPLEMLFDYVRIRFPTMDVEYVIQNILQLKIEYMLHEDYGFYNYDEHYYFGNIFVLVSKDAEKGVLIELKGQGCRQLEDFMLAQHRSWYDFFELVEKENGVFKRIDLAINDKTGILDIPVLTEKCNSEECISVFRSFKSYQSGELTKSKEKIGMGNTLYIGSMKSEVYFCVYEKDYEQYKKYDIPIEDADVKNRFEIRLKDDRAKHAIRDLLDYRNAEKTAFEIINRYIKFVDKEEDKKRSDWKTNQYWDWFIGKGRGKLRLTTKPEPYSFERTLKWIRTQVAPMINISLAVDEFHGTDRTNEIIKAAKITDKHMKILEQQTVAVENMVITK